MARPPKAVDMILAEKKSHRTKAELEHRKQGEALLSTGQKLKERLQVKASVDAHREFMRVNKLLKSINKNDALYESIINRYCLLSAECIELEQMKKQFAQSKNELMAEYCSGKADESVKGGLKPSAYYKLVSEMQKNIITIDKQIVVKQRMMFDIEKECAMTISSAIRNIPKTPEKNENPLLKILADD